MKQNTSSLRNSGLYTSPATPEYGDDNVRGFQKGWSSERVPLGNSSRRHISATALLPFNSGRTVPSKWDDADRWITSPVSSYGVWKTPNVQPYRRPKSKSGPLGAPGIMYLPNYSPSAPILEGGSVSNFIANSPFTTGVLVPDGVSIHYGAGGNSGGLYAENSMARATSAPGLSDLFSESSVASSQDDDTKEPDSVSFAASRRDMATQMSPGDSTHASPQERSSSIPSGVEQNKQHSAKVEIRDVRVDKGAPISGLSRRSRVRKPKKELPDVSESISPWDVADRAKNVSKSQREEARITAWENLQKAKAEAEIQKLEMKLEKKRSASMDKIVNKLRHAQLKAQDMRRATSESQPRQSRRDSHRIIPFRQYFKIASFRSCFVCRIP
ncbi:putative MAP kinase kinase kinase mkh1-like isoform 1 [Capsicum annuum]|uniref:Remorin C-terminal domain-containing protein n=1 Tax=Capsicum annuum TaxID=4072 RepID=A0A1U8FXA2_CAPAN|nr:uncharacterized protein LOC107860295 [Capsicum annuum]KAF3639450.1 putative MAP kinase kinase kinase mkh1-like isoform 1 [Capsicum annuum]KAF3646304.1 putative MAP kinase kinase kinase mkh1-like isoform 1 [Capsicum annuum]PHT90001.1 hypothetical protein T459_05114 [Capsicum annuum]